MFLCWKDSFTFFNCINTKRNTPWGKKKTVTIQEQGKKNQFITFTSLLFTDKLESILLSLAFFQLGNKDISMEVSLLSKISSPDCYFSFPLLWLLLGVYFRFSSIVKHHQFSNKVLYFKRKSKNILSKISALFVVVFSFLD